MKNLYWLTLISGICFGLWPLTLKHSGLKGNVASVVLSLFTVVLISPFCYRQFGELQKTNLWLVSTAAILGVIGITAFNSLLGKADTAHLPTLIIIMILVQVACPVIYDLSLNGSMSFTKICGLAFALIGTILLIKK